MSAADLQVKNLDWVTVEEGQRAITVCGMYAISPKGNKLTLTGMPGNLLGRFDSIEGAKFAAQADYKTRILSAISTQMSGVEEVLHKLLADIVESHDTSNYDGGDLRKWIWTLQELIEIPRDQR